MLSCSKQESKVTLENLIDKASYAAGLNLGKQFKMQGVKFNLDAVKMGMEDGITDKTPALSDKELRESMVAFQKEAWSY